MNHLFPAWAAMAFALLLHAPACRAGDPPVSTSPQTACTAPADQAALRRLQQHVAAADVLKGRAAAACVEFIAEACDARSVTVAVRERHGGRCAGDPQTAALLERFRVHKPAGAIERYDAVADEYRPF